MPFDLTSGLRFFEQAHIKDVAAFLKWAVNPRDEVAFKRMVRLLPGVGPRSAEGLWEKVLASLTQAGLRDAAISPVEAAAPTAPAPAPAPTPAPTGDPIGISPGKNPPKRCRKRSRIPGRACPPSRICCSRSRRPARPRKPGSNWRSRSTNSPPAGQLAPPAQMIHSVLEAHLRGLRARAISQLRTTPRGSQHPRAIRATVRKPPAISRSTRPAHQSRYRGQRPGRSEARHSLQRAPGEGP
ncbi:MAG: 3'-5' exonuclease [Chthoniobacter sp.]